MPRLTLKFFRGEEVKRRLESLPSRLAAPVREAMLQGGHLVAERAKILVPKDDRILERSIRAELVRGGTRQNVPLLKIGPSARFLEQHGRIPNLARWIEFGTRPVAAGQTHRISINKRGRATKKRRNVLGAHHGTSARPYLFPAWRQMKKQVRALIAKAVNKVLKEKK